MKCSCGEKVKWRDHHNVLRESLISMLKPCLKRENTFQFLFTFTFEICILL